MFNLTDPQHHLAVAHADHALEIALVADRQPQFDLGLLPGEVLVIKGQGVRLPHVGWNELSLTAADPLFQGLSTTPEFYFDHSYTVACDPGMVTSVVSYHGTQFPASIWRGNVFGIQCHPEKGHRSGLAYIKNFVRFSMDTHG